jgi:hypothetical protein
MRNLPGAGNNDRLTPITSEADRLTARSGSS